MLNRAQHDPDSASTHGGEPGAGVQDTHYFAQLNAAKYMLLTTFKRDGTPVPTPVHVAVEGGHVYFRTWNPSGKWKRLRHTQRVLAAPCTSRGRSSGPPIQATAHLLSGPESADAARALARKYPILHGVLIPLAHRIRRWQTVQYELRAPSATDTAAAGPR
jgi:PPOX class probable F420-dependent enzyme